MSVHECVTLFTLQQLRKHDVPIHPKREHLEQVELLKFATHATNTHLTSVDDDFIQVLRPFLHVLHNDSAIVLRQLHLHAFHGKLFAPYLLRLPAYVQNAFRRDNIPDKKVFSL